MTTNTQTILVVEDETKIAQLLQAYLVKEGYHCHCLHHGDEVIPWLTSNKADLVVLDLMLPGRDGLDLAPEIANLNIPIIMATAKVNENERIEGLGIGADDYVCKPYSMREMVARVSAVLRRSQSPTRLTKQATTSQQRVQVIDKHMRILVDQQALDLTPVEFRLLSMMIHNQDVVYSRNELLDHIYDDYRLVTDRTIDSHIKNLRRKLHQAGLAKDTIKSIYGVGYTLTFNS